MKSTSEQTDHAPINDFNGHYQFLNNDYPAWVCLDSELYPSASIAYQAARTSDHGIRQRLQNVETYEEFKTICLDIPNPPDWYSKKYKAMQKIIRDKFKRTKQLGSKLAATHPRKLVNTFRNGAENELFWGVIEGKGNNSLGKILMTIRDQILNNSDWQRWIIDQGLQAHEKKRCEAFLLVTKEDKPIDKLILEKKSKFFFGAMANNQIKLDHPSISKRHACIYFGQNCTLMLVDLGSTHGTFLTRQGSTIKLENLKPVRLQNGDLIVFGLSSRKYKVDINQDKARAYLSDRNHLQQKTNPSKSKGRQSRSRSRSPKNKQKRRQD